MVTLDARLQYTRDLRKRFATDPILFEYLEWVEGRIVTAMAAPSKGQGAGGGEARAKSSSFNKVEWQRLYMRDHRRGIRRRKAKPPAQP